MPMARPPLGPEAMDYTVKFRLRGDEYRALKRIAGTEGVSSTLRGLIADEDERRRGKS